MKAPIKIFMTTVIFTLVMFIAFSSSITAYANDDNISYKFIEDEKTLVITGKGYIPNFDVEGEFPGGLTDAPWRQYFYKTKIIIIEEGITELHYNTFYGFDWLEKIYLPNSIQLINYSSVMSDSGGFVDDIEVYYNGSIFDKKKIEGESLLLTSPRVKWYYFPPDGPLVKEDDGKWHYYPNGQKSTKTTLVKYANKWFYVENGVWNTKYTGFFKYKSKWFYIENGKWNRSVETMTKYKGKWFYIKNGKWDSDATKFFKYKGKTFYIKNGKWDKTITTLAKYNGKLRYVKNGKLSKNTTFFEYNNKLYYIENGVAYSDFSGKLTIENGALKNLTIS